MYAKAAACIKDLKTKDIGKHLRVSDVDHLANLFVLTALTTYEIEVEVEDNLMSCENVDMYDRVHAPRVMGCGLWGWLCPRRPNF